MSEYKKLWMTRGLYALGADPEYYGWSWLKRSKKCDPARICRTEAPRTWPRGRWMLFLEHFQVNKAGPRTPGYKNSNWRPWQHTGLPLHTAVPSSRRKPRLQADKLPFLLNWKDFTARMTSTSLHLYPNIYQEMDQLQCISFELIRTDEDGSPSNRPRNRCNGTAPSATPEKLNAVRFPEHRRTKQKGTKARNHDIVSQQDTSTFFIFLYFLPLSEDFSLNYF